MSEFVVTFWYSPGEAQEVRFVSIVLVVPLKGWIHESYQLLVL